MTAFYPLEYLNIIKKRKAIFLFVFCLIGLVGAILSMGWSKYTASATIEVANPEISMEAVSSAQDSSASAEVIADLQISRLKQQVLSVNSLAEIIAKLNLYSELRQTTPITSIAKTMRDNVNIQMMSSSLANPNAAQKASAVQLSAIAFSISFEYSDPLLAQKTVNELISRFLDADLKERRETAEKTSEFLAGQIDVITKSLEEQESKIADFRNENGNISPESLNFNQQVSVSIGSRIMALDSEITSNLGRIGSLRSQLVQTEPYLTVIDEENGEVIVPPSVQLRSLESQYAALTARYSSDHPDVRNVARQIETLRQQVGSNKTANRVTDADNPAYLQIIAQLEAAQQQQSALERQKQEIISQQGEYQQAIAANPNTEQEFARLNRDYENLMVLYRNLKAKKLAADMNKTIEEGHVGRRLAVIDPPELPVSTNPSRKILLAASLVLAFMAASATVVALHLMSQRVIGPHHLESLIGTAPLARIPKLKTLKEKISLRRKIMLAVLALILLVATFITVFLQIAPFDFIR